MIKIKRGLTLPISGEPEQIVHAASKPSRVGVLPADYPGLDLQLCVASGDSVRTGQALLCDRRFPEITVTAPATGRVDCIRAADDSVQAVAIAVAADEFVEFASMSFAELATAGRATIAAQLLTAGLWPAFRTRPFLKTPHPDAFAHAIFVTAMDTQPLSVRADTLIETEQEAFGLGLAAISQLTVGLVYVCKAPAAYVPVPDIENVKVEEFAGPHPAGLAGTHIHYLDPVGADAVKQVWSIGYQDVIAIGKLFATGRYAPERVIALGGPQVVDPRLLRVRLGADIGDLVTGELREGDTQVIAGSVFAGVAGGDRDFFLGRGHLQITALRAAVADNTWWRWGLHQFSVLPIFLSRLTHGRRFRFASAAQPEPRPLLPTAAFEKVWPLRLLHVPLLRALDDGDTERAIALGALELAEEDLALSTFVCAGKRDFGPMLRAVLESCERRELQPLAATESVR